MTAWWSSGFPSASLAASHALNHFDAEVVSQEYSTRRGFAVRCVRAAYAYGCTDNNFMEYDPAANINDGSCATTAIPGCTDPDFIQYDPTANLDDGSCSELTGCADGETVEYAGDTYHTITIGEQCWFLENLNADQYQDGTPIPEIQDAGEWVASTVGIWRYFNNNPEYYGEPRGKLYSGNVVLHDHHCWGPQGRRRRDGQPHGGPARERALGGHAAVGVVGQRLR